MAQGTDRRQVLEEEVTAAVCAAITNGFSGPINNNGDLDGRKRSAPGTQAGKKGRIFSARIVANLPTSSERCR